MDPSVAPAAHRVLEVFERFLLQEGEPSSALDKRTCDQISKNSIYRLDKQLYKDYINIYDDLIADSPYLRDSKQRDHSEDFSYSVSFSFLRKGIDHSMMSKRSERNPSETVLKDFIKDDIRYPPELSSRCPPH